MEYNKIDVCHGIINGKQAYLKKNTSVDFIFENRLFTGSDSYTLSITFPLKGCAQNIAIFGHIHRTDVIKSKPEFGIRKLMWRD